MGEEADMIRYDIEWFAQKRYSDCEIEKEREKERGG